MSSRNGSFASKVDGNSIKATSNSKITFTQSSENSHQSKAKSAAARYKPSPEREPRPRGMGERAVVRQTHLARKDALSQSLGGRFQAQAKPPKSATLEKAKKAVKRMPTELSQNRSAQDRSR